MLATITKFLFYKFENFWGKKPRSKEKDIVMICVTPKSHTTHHILSKTKPRLRWHAFLDSNLKNHKIWMHERSPIIY